MLKQNKRSVDKTSAAEGEPTRKKTPKGEKNVGRNKPVNNKVADKSKSTGSKFIKHNKKPGTGNDAGRYSKGKFAANTPRKSFDKKDATKNGKDTGPVIAEKKDWNKFKQDKKELKLKRKQSKDSYQITNEAKQIYEKLKCRRTEEKSKLVEKLYNMFSVGDTIKKIVMAHDTARILQCMLKFASPAVRDQLSEKLLPHTVEMSVSKYSHFCVLRMLKYGSPSVKSKLVDSLLGNIVKLASHNISSKILDHIYLSVATAQQKIYMRQEFYGDLYKKAKDDNVKQLADTYKETTNMKTSILGSVKSNLEHVANKQLVDSSLVHAVMLEYLQVCEDDKIEETVSAFATLIPMMLTTKEGSQAAIICFYKSTPKNRRAIIKNIKEHLVKICTHEHGHVFMLAVLNSLDDTKATKKAIYDNIHADLQTLMSNQWGRRVVEWLVSPADTKGFHPSFISTIEEGLQFGKKDKDVRRKEIFEQIEEPIANAIAEHAEFWISNSHIALVTADILKQLSSANFLKAAEALAAIIAQPHWSVSIADDSVSVDNAKKKTDFEKIIADANKQKRLKKKVVAVAVDNDANDSDSATTTDEVKKSISEPEVNTVQVAGIEEAGFHIILKKIIKADKQRVAEAGTFGKLLLQQLTEETLQYWLSVNRACFILLNIIEQNDEGTTQTLKQLLTKNLQKTLKQQQTKGAELLAKKLNFE